jgi:hypothetical protein
LDHDRRGRTAIACEGDSTTIRIDVYGFEEVVPKVTINIRQLRFVENKHSLPVFNPPFLDFKIISPAIPRLYVVMWPPLHPNYMGGGLLLSDMIMQ